ncbi:MAG: MFS transporter [Candidatus Micrarchaeota archaeon]
MRSKSKLSKNTKLLALTSFLVDISSEMVVPLLPFFVTTILGAPLFVLGLIEAVRELTANVVGIFSGIISDKLGKKKNIIILGYSLSGLMKVFLVTATTWFSVLPIVFFERVGKGIREAPRDALITHSEPKENLGYAFGFRKMCDNAGAFIGPILATFLLTILISQGVDYAYRTIFLIALIPAALSIVVLLFLQEKDGHKATDGVKTIIGDVLKIPNFKKFVFCMFLFSLGQFAISFFLIRAADYLTLFLIPVVYLAYNAMYTVLSLPAGYFTDKVGAKNSLLFSQVLFLTVLLGFSFFANSVSLFLFFGLFGVFMTINETAPRVFLAKSVDHKHYASSIGLYQGLIGVAALPANILAGFLYTTKILDVPASFVFSIVTTVLSMLLLLILVKE